MRFVALALQGLASPALAASAADATAAGDPGVGGMLRVLVSLAVVVALIFGASALLRRVQRGTARGTRIRCLESVAVGMKERVVLVEAGATQMLIGVAPGSVRTLHVFDAPIAAAADAATETPSFRGVLSHLRGVAPR